jgi:hypothetical protein
MPEGELSEKWYDEAEDLAVLEFGCELLDVL